MEFCWVYKTYLSTCQLCRLLIFLKSKLHSPWLLHCHHNFSPAKPCLVLYLCKHTFFRFCFYLIFFIPSSRGCLERQDYGLGFGTYWYMMQNRKPLIRDAEQQNILIHDAEQSLTHSSLMDIALQYLKGVEIRIIIYFMKKKSFMTLNISRNILILQTAFQSRNWLLLCARVDIMYNLEAKVGWSVEWVA